MVLLLPLLSQKGFEPRTAGALSGQWVRSALLLDLFRLESMAGRRLRGLGDLDPLRSRRNVLVTTESRRIGSSGGGDSFQQWTVIHSALLSSSSNQEEASQARYMCAKKPFNRTTRCNGATSFSRPEQPLMRR